MGKASWFDVYWRESNGGRNAASPRYAAWKAALLCSHIHE